MLCFRDSFGGQLQLALAKADSEQLARSIAEEQLSDVEKEKTMLELELKEAMGRHKSDLTKKEISISTVSTTHIIFTKTQKLEVEIHPISDFGRKL